MRHKHGLTQAPDRRESALGLFQAEQWRLWDDCLRAAHWHKVRAHHELKAIADSFDQRRSALPPLRERGHFAGTRQRDSRLHSRRFLLREVWRGSMSRLLWDTGGLRNTRIPQPARLASQHLRRCVYAQMLPRRNMRLERGLAKVAGPSA